MSCHSTLVASKTALEHIWRVRWHASLLPIVNMIHAPENTSLDLTANILRKVGGLVGGLGKGLGDAVGGIG